MDNHKTVEEKGAEWHISTRHIQYLCRIGKIEGAVKRAGSWFIPADAASPAQNSKAGIKSFHFVGTKRKIFHSAIELFMQNGFDSVTLKDITDKVGIQQSTIYNHFKSKQEILDTIYNYYCHNYLEDRPRLEDIKPGMEHKNLIEIMESIRYYFKPASLQEMSNITKIIFQRIGIDSRANEIAKSLMLHEGIKYVEEVFNKSIEIGRLAPFDTHLLAVFINSIRFLTLFYWIVDPSPDTMKRLLEDEQKLYQHASKLLKDLNPPNANHCAT